MVGSNLVKEFVPAYSGNYNQGRFGNQVKKITVHHMAARWTAKRCGESFQAKGREASSHYGIGYEGELAQYVSEEDTAWTDSNRTSNRTSITIECANESMGDPWRVSDKTVDTLVLLMVDIAKRYGFGTFVKGTNLTWHQMYSATACPGPYLLSKLDEIIGRANAILAGETKPPKEEAAPPKEEPAPPKEEAASPKEEPTPQPTPTPSPSEGNVADPDAGGKEAFLELLMVWLKKWIRSILDRLE